MAFEGAGKVAGLEIWRIEVIFTLLHIFHLAKLDSTEKGEIFLNYFCFRIEMVRNSMFPSPIQCIYKNTSLAVWLNIWYFDPVF
jgi:hypothetical protein